MGWPPAWLPSMTACSARHPDSPLTDCSRQVRCEIIPDVASGPIHPYFPRYLSYFRLLGSEIHFFISHTRTSGKTKRNFPCSPVAPPARSFRKSPGKHGWCIWAINQKKRRTPPTIKIKRDKYQHGQSRRQSFSPIQINL